MEIKKESGVIKTDFDIEAILRACPELLKAWKRKPFILKYNTNYEVVVDYLEVKR